MMRAAYLDGLVTLFYDGSIEIYNEGLHEEVEDAGVWWEKLMSDDSGIEWESLNLSDECKEIVIERQLIKSDLLRR